MVFIQQLSHFRLVSWGLRATAVALHGSAGLTQPVGYGFGIVAYEV